MQSIPNKWIEKEPKKKEKPIPDSVKTEDVSTKPYIHLARATRMRTLRGMRK